MLCISRRVVVKQVGDCERRNRLTREMRIGVGVVCGLGGPGGKDWRRLSIRPESRFDMRW